MFLTLHLSVCPSEAARCLSHKLGNNLGTRMRDLNLHTQFQNTTVSFKKKRSRLKTNISSDRPPGRQDYNPLKTESCLEILGISGCFSGFPLSWY